MDRDESPPPKAKPGAPPPLPAKHYHLFRMECNAGCNSKEMFEGKMGELPILFAVNVGYNPEDEDPFMYPYESDELFFAYKLGRQERVMIEDYHMQTWSLPVSSPLRFNTDKLKDVTLSKLLDTETLPVNVTFSKSKCLQFESRNPNVPTPSRSKLTLTRVYHEPYYWCLSLTNSGGVNDKPLVLPRNLIDVCFSKIVSVAGAEDSQAMIEEYKQRYSRIAEEKNFQGDPFFKELALVCRGPQPVETVHPYIDQDTFLTIQQMPRYDTPLPPTPHKVPPAPPPRARHGGADSARESRLSDTNTEAEGDVYSALDFTDQGGDPHLYGDSPVYYAPRDLGIPRPDNSNTNSDTGNSISISSNSSSTFASPNDRLLPRVPTNDDSSGKQHPLFSSWHSSDLSARKDTYPVTRSPSVDSSPLPLSMKASSRSIKPHPTLPPRRRRVDLKSLTVDDVSDRLKALGLSKKLVKKFYKNRIDGVLLEKLNESTLKKEFGMSHVEFLLLNTFITEGHIPQSSPPSNSIEKK